MVLLHYGALRDYQVGISFSQERDVWVSAHVWDSSHYFDDKMIGFNKIAQLDHLQSYVSPCIVSKGWVTLRALLKQKWIGNFT